MGLGKVTQRLGNLRLVLFPAFAATASRWRPQTEDPAAAFGQATRDGLAPPPQDSFRHQGVARTRFQRHRSLKRAPFGASQCGCREAEIGALRRSERRSALPCSVLHAQARTSCIESGFTFLEDPLRIPTLPE